MSQALDEEREDDRTHGAATRQAAPDGPRRERARFIVLAGETLGQMFRIERPETVIGCAAEADIRVLDDGVSRRHARIVLDDEEVCIEDLESVTGTLLNGDRVRRVVLRDGDQIQIGSTTVLQFTHADEPAADAHPRMHRAIWQVGPTRAWLCLQKGR